MEKDRNEGLNKHQIWLLPALTATAVIVLDQITKVWIWNMLGPEVGSSIPLVGEWLKFTLVKNTGVAFGLFQNIPQFFTFTSVLISLGAIYFYRYHLPNQRLIVQFCTGLIIGGAIGNIIDRLTRGFVVDFIHVTWFPGIFNVADSGITVGVITLAIYLLLLGEEQPPQTSPADNSITQ